jgi:hypothetical protein
VADIVDVRQTGNAFSDRLQQMVLDSREWTSTSRYPPILPERSKHSL